MGPCSVLRTKASITNPHVSHETLQPSNSKITTISYDLRPLTFVDLSEFLKLNTGNMYNSNYNFIELEQRVQPENKSYKILDMKTKLKLILN